MRPGDAARLGGNVRVGSFAFDADQLVKWCNEHGTAAVWAAMQKGLAANANSLGGLMRTILEERARGP